MIHILLEGLITGTLVSKFGTKVCGCTGAVLSAVGIGVCFTATNLEFVIICIGVVAGQTNKHDIL